MTIEDEKTLNRAWEYHKQSDTIHVYRFNYSMVAQYMLIVSFATLFASDKQHGTLRLVEVTICLFGLVFTYFQHILSRSLALLMQFLQDNYLTKLDPVFADFWKARKMPITLLQSKWIPISLAITWVVFLGATLISIAEAREIKGRASGPPRAINFSHTCANGIIPILNMVTSLTHQRHSSGDK